MHDFQATGEDSLLPRSEAGRVKAGGRTEHTEDINDFDYQVDSRVQQSKLDVRETLGTPLLSTFFLRSFGEEASSPKCSWPLG